MFKALLPFLERRKIIIFLLCFLAISLIVIGFVFASKKHSLVKGVAITSTLGQEKDDITKNTDTNADKENSLLSPTSNPTFVDCVGPDGKTAHATQEDCGNVTNYWKNHQSSGSNNGSNNSNNSGNKTGDSDQNTPTPIPTPATVGWWYTNGNQIMSDIGNDNNASNDIPIRFKGINSSGFEWGAGDEWGSGKCADYGCWSRPYSGEYDNLQAWGFNVVRLPLAWANLEPNIPNGNPNDPSFHQYNNNYLLAIDQAINEFGRRNIKVILDMHQWAWSPIINPYPNNQNEIQHGAGFPVWLYKPQATQSKAQEKFFADNKEILPGYSVQQGLIDAEAFLAKRYKDNPTIVGIDMFNEPPANYNGDSDHPNQQKLRLFYEHAGNAIATVNPKLLLIAEEGINGSYRLQKPNLSNLIYSFHLYISSWAGPSGDRSSGQTLIQNRLNKAIDWGVPIWMGEFDYVGKIDAPSTDTISFLNFCKENNISWTYWAYQRSPKSIVDESTSHKFNLPLVQVLQEGF